MTSGQVTRMVWDRRSRRLILHRDSGVSGLGISILGAPQCPPFCGPAIPGRFLWHSEISIFPSNLFRGAKRTEDLTHAADVSLPHGPSAEDVCPLNKLLLPSMTIQAINEIPLWIVKRTLNDVFVIHFELPNFVFRERPKALERLRTRDLFYPRGQRCSPNAYSGHPSRLHRPFCQVPQSLP